jgi:replicative DNA helicase
MKRPHDPHDAGAESAILGAMITDESSCQSALGELSEGDFYLEQHREVFRAIAVLYEAGGAPDSVAVASELGPKGRQLVFSLVEAIPTYAGLPRWISILKDLSRRRGVLARAEKVVEAAASGDPLRAVEDLNRFATDTAEGKGVITFADGHRDYIERVMLRKAGESIMGIPTGLSNLDKATLGFHGGDLIYIGARPSMAKTLFLWQAAITAARHGYPAFVMNLEMAFDRIQERSACAISGVSYENWRRGNITGEDAGRLVKASEHLSGLPLSVHNPKKGRTVEDLRQALRALKPSIAFVDYVQLLRTRQAQGSDRYASVSLISNDLKQMALELNIPIVAVSQLSRGVEERWDKRPVMADLRESGYIEQDADVILMMYRDAYYYPEGVRDGKNGPEPVDKFHPQKVEFIARKDREGGNWTVPAFFEGERMWLSEHPYSREAVA